MDTSVRFYGSDWDTVAYILGLIPVYYKGVRFYVPASYTGEIAACLC